VRFIQEHQDIITQRQHGRDVVAKLLILGVVDDADGPLAALKVGERSVALTVLEIASWRMAVISTEQRVFEARDSARPAKAQIKCHKTAISYPRSRCVVMKISALLRDTKLERGSELEPPKADKLSGLDRLIRGGGDSNRANCLS
jgi:hypothetical protein